MNKEISKNTNMILFLISVGVMLLCTKSSPLYPMNDWLDANAFFTMGKGMFQGMVPYRDLYDHKGPILYILHGLAWLISNRTFLGVWIAEVVAGYFFLLYSYKTVYLFYKGKIIFFMPIFAAIVYSSNHMRHGDSVEEFCLPLLIYALYISLRCIVEKSNFTNKELIVVGITSACVLWTKYTILGFYLGWFVLPVITCIWNREWKEIGRMCLMIGTGVMIISIPLLLYFVCNHALDDLFIVYFYNNIFVYAGEKVSLLRMIIRTVSNVAYVVYRNRKIFFISLMGISYLLYKRQFLVLIQIGFSTLALMFTVLSVETVHGYYSLCFSYLGALGIYPLCEAISAITRKISNEKESIKIRGVIMLLSFVVMFGISYLDGYNTYLLNYKRQDLPQYQFAEIINQSEHPTLLNYGDLDLGVYTTTGLLPACKFFCELNIDLKEMRDAQCEIVEKGQVEYIVTRNREFEWPLYEKIAESAFMFEGKERMFYLYKLKE